MLQISEILKKKFISGNRSYKNQKLKVIFSPNIMFNLKVSLYFYCMMDKISIQLHNPVWHSLCETHEKFVIEYNNVKFYHPDICSFGSFTNEESTYSALNQYAKLTNEFFLVSENKTPTFDKEKIILSKKIEGCQMILNQLVEIKVSEKIIPLSNKHIDEIYDLVWLVMPGYYEKRSFEMGDYFGIFKDNKLVAISGQRMQSNHWTEISAVVTHPDYTRQGLSKQLVAHTTKEILKQNKKPILHTNKGNPAIKLYEKLGFTTSRDMNWWYFNKK
jgi:GNAT superfamily N-acetyltransferase|tara:strand:+ start:413 stop:1234 length:822 start_codon:yes stop_codon:yes gene_type:complete